VTDNIVVPVADSPESSRALEFASLLAAAHGGTVTLLVAPRSDPAIERAIAASTSVVLRAPGADPRVYGAPRPPERVIPAAAAALKASLVVLDGARSQAEKRTSALLAGAIGCSVLSVPRL
jgi:nucleotide-binding universal stress UspA family protein